MTEHTLIAAIVGIAALGLFTAAPAFGRMVARMVHPTHRPQM